MWNSDFVMLRLMGAPDPFMSMARGGGGSPDYPAPDKRIGEAALKTAQLSEEALLWYKNIYEQDAPYREELRDISTALATEQVEAAKKNQGYAEDYYGYMRDTFRPMEKGIVDDAQKFSTEAEKERLAGAAAADVSAAGANQRAQMSRQLAGMGVNPNSPRFQALQNDSNIIEAATRAGAMTRARQGADQQGWARKMDAASLGRNLPANQATSQGVALAAGNSAVNSANAPSANSALYGSLMGQGFQSAINGTKASGDLLNTQYSTQVSAWGAAQQAQAAETAGMWGGVGTAAGIAAAVMLSSKDMKTKKKPISSALEGLRGVPVEKWQYKKGVADEGEHIGPYAEDMQKEFGDKVAPGGKMIDIISALGINTAAIKELDKKVSRLEKRS